MNLFTFSKWLLFTSIVSGNMNNGQDGDRGIYTTYMGQVGVSTLSLGISEGRTCNISCMVHSTCWEMSIDHIAGMERRMEEPWYGSQYEKITNRPGTGFSIRSYERNCSVDNGNVNCSFWIPSTRKILNLYIAVDSTNCYFSYVQTSHGTLNQVFLFSGSYGLFDQNNTLSFNVTCTYQPHLKAKLFVWEYICY